jgi:hypothetical protein
LALLVLALDVLIAIVVVYIYARLHHISSPQFYASTAAVSVALWSTRIAGTGLMFGTAWFFGRGKSQKAAYIASVVLFATYAVVDAASTGFQGVFNISFAFTMALKLCASLCGAAIATFRSRSIE